MGITWLGGCGKDDLSQKDLAIPIVDSQHYDVKTENLGQGIYAGFYKDGVVVACVKGDGYILKATSETGESQICETDICPYSLARVNEDNISVLGFDDEYKTIIYKEYDSNGEIINSFSIPVEGNISSKIEPEVIYCEETGTGILFLICDFCVRGDFGNESLQRAYRIDLRDGSYNTCELEGIIVSAQYVDDVSLMLIQDKDGGYYKVSVDMTDLDKTREKKIEGETWILGNALCISSDLEDVYCMMLGDLVTYSLSNGKYERVASMGSWGATEENLLSFKEINGEYRFILADENELYSVRVVATDKKSEKKELTVGIFGYSDELERAVSRYNISNNDIQVVIKQYQDISEDGDAGIQKMGLDILSGNGPDIIDVSLLDVENLIEKGMLDDLYGYFAGDERINKESLINNVYESYERDGELFYISPNFNILTAMGPKRIWGDFKGRQVDDMLSFLKSKGKDINSIYGFSADEEIITTLTRMDMEELIDFSAKKTYFESERFYDLLEFADKYKPDFSGESVIAMERSGKIILELAIINSVRDYQRLEAAFGEELTSVGYPGSSGSGTKCSFAGPALGISSKSGYKEEAWDFLKYYLENGDSYGFSIFKDKLEEQFEEERASSFDEDGNEWPHDVLQDGDFVEMIYAADDSDINATRDIISCIDGKSEYNGDINRIIEEESAAFFSGSKSAEEVGRIIDSRVRVFMNENYKE